MTAARARPFFPILVAAFTLIAFLPSLASDFVNWDDSYNLVQNPNYRGLGGTQLEWMWTTQLGDHYIPLTWMSFGLDYKIWGMDPFGYHLVNVLLHTANAVLFYFLALVIFNLSVPQDSQLARSRIPVAALAAALLFAVHPLRVESVAWVTERRDVLSGLFYLLAILAYLRAVPGPGREARRKYYWLALGCFLLAMLCKEIVLTLPAVLLVLDVYPLRRLGGRTWEQWIGTAARRVWLEKIPFAVISLAIIPMMLYIEKHGLRTAPLEGLGWFPRMAVPIYGLAFYLRKTVAPFHLSPLYVFTGHKIDPAAAPFLLSAAAVLAVTVAAILLRKKFPALLAVWAVYCITLSPVLGAVSNGPEIASDRNSYLACLGWTLLAGAAVFAARQREPRLFAAGGIAIILGLAGLTWQQAGIWHDSDALWTRALAVEPSAIAYTNMGEALVSRGDELWAKEHFLQAIALDPAFSPAHLGLGGVCLRMHKPTEAAVEFQAVLHLGKDLAFAHNGLACALAMQGKLDAAIDHFQQALRLDPGYADARRNLNQVLARK